MAKPGKPTVSPEVAERFRKACEYLLSQVSPENNVAKLQRYAAAVGHTYSATAWRNLLSGDSAPAIHLQEAIAMMLRVEPRDISSGEWQPGMTTPQDSRMRRG